MTWTARKTAAGSLPHHEGSNSRSGSFSPALDRPGGLSYLTISGLMPCCSTARCSAAEMREIDRSTSERFGVPSLTLMENAGAAVARFVLSDYPQAERVGI